MPQQAKQTNKPDPSAKPEAQDPAEGALDIEDVPDIELPAVGESVAYITVDPNTREPIEEAALITGVQSDGVTVSLTVFALHSRAGRPMMDVHMGPHTDPDNLTPYWRYPAVKAVRVEEEVPADE